jgi:hypothetical protein
MKKEAKKTEIGPSSEPVEGIATIDFGIPTTAPGKAKKSKYPSIEGPGVAKLVDEILRLHEKFKGIEGPYLAAKETMKIEFGFPQYFDKNRGRIDAPSSMIADGSKGEVLVIFQERFRAGDSKKREKLYKLMGEKKAGEFFYQSWVFSVNG